MDRWCECIKRTEWDADERRKRRLKKQNGDVFQQRVDSPLAIEAHQRIIDQPFPLCQLDWRGGADPREAGVR